MEEVKRREGRSPRSSRADLKRDEQSTAEPPLLSSHSLGVLGVQPETMASSRLKKKIDNAEQGAYGNLNESFVSVGTPLPSLVSTVSSLLSSRAS